MDNIKIKGSLTLNQMFEALLKTARGLQRDFGEVENLQRSLKGSSGFVKTAIERIEEMILSDLQLVRPLAGITTTTRSISGQTNDDFVLSLSGADNFVHGISHFAISLALREKDETTIALVFNPIDDRLYYAEKGEGAYIFSPFHRQRMRVSERVEKEDLLILTDSLKHDFLAKNDIEKVRLTGCPALDMCWIASGKADVLVMEQKDFAEICAGELIVRESKGITIDKGDKLLVLNNSIQLSE